MIYLPYFRSSAKLEAELEVNEWLRKIHAEIGPMEWSDTPRPGAYIRFEEDDEE